jgi:fumarylacetoacetase
LQLQVGLRSASMAESQVISASNSKDLFWTLGQMLTHHASNGCPMRVGDLIASGTISGEAADSAGCLLELTWQGPGQPRQPVQLPGGERRTFLQEGDEVVLSGWGRRPGFRSIGLGRCSGRIS